MTAATSGPERSEPRDMPTIGSSDDSRAASRTALFDGFYAAVDALLDHAVACLGLDSADLDWARNGILARYGLDSYRPAAASGSGVEAGAADPSGAAARVDDLVRTFAERAVAAGVFTERDGPAEADAVMGMMSGRPSALQHRFLDIERDRGGMAAMRWFYGYCVDNSYVRRAKLDANPRFDSHGLTITINLAKPEFGNMAAAAAGNSVEGGYPRCTICHENEGFAGRRRCTLRTIPVTLGGERWFWQFSPYGYFDQHGICVNAEHTPMHVDRGTFVRLLDFVDRFPGYFIGCNAALPRIGGSVLAHDHFQGGGETMPMFRAPVWGTMRCGGHPDAVVEILDWPGSALRVVSRSRRAVVDVCDAIREGWEAYAAPALHIAAHDASGNRQSALSPSVVVTGRGYEMHLILRNNAVSEAYPEGVFHARPEYHAIKREPIGLIEAQGLFILPGRLVGQLGEMEDALAAGAGMPASLDGFGLVWRELTAALDGSRDRAAIRAAIRDELGSVCERILRNTAVFPRKELIRSFLAGLGFVGR